MSKFSKINLDDLDKEFLYYPIFITGPAIQYSTDRKRVLFFMSKNKHFKYFLPDDLSKLALGKSRLKPFAEFCIKRTFQFESVLSSISLANIMFPHTGSSIYELGQFNSLVNNKTLIYLPKNFNDYKNIPTLGTYIEWNHYKEYIKYKSNGKRFPYMDKNWKYKHFNILSKTLKSQRLKMRVRYVNDQRSKVTENSPYKFKESDKIHFVLKAVYPFISEIIKIHSLSILRDLNKFEDELISLIKKKYDLENKIILHLNSKKYTRKDSLFGLSIIAIKTKTSNLRSEELFKNEKYHKFKTQKGREVFTYAESEKGDLLKIRHKTLIKTLNNIQIHKSVHAYVKKNNSKIKNWITNAAIHKNFKIKKGFIYKTDISDFFNSIDLNILNEKIESFGLQKVKSIDLKQGMITAPILSNIYLKDFDKNIFEFCKINNLRYSRYSDDITISTKRNFNKDNVNYQIVHIKLKEELKKIRLKINGFKTHVMSSDTDLQYINITGILLQRNGTLKLSRRHSQKIQAWTRNPNKYGLSDKYVSNYKKALKKYKIKFIGNYPFMVGNYFFYVKIYMIRFIIKS